MTYLPLAAATEVGALRAYQLKRLWSRSMAARLGQSVPASMHERHLDHLVIHACGLGLEQTAAYLEKARELLGQAETIFSVCLYEQDQC